MKKIILFTLSMLLIIAVALSQNIGFNGAGFFESRTDKSDQWLKELNEPFTLRVPGGAIAKFADPFSNTKGWGLTYAGVDSIQAKYGSDEEEDQTGALEKWHRKVDEQPAGSYLDELIEFQKLFPDMRVIWVCNVFIGPKRNADAIEYLLAGGVNIVALEMGNETYGQLKYDIEKYKRLTGPLITELSRFNIPISHIAANNKTNLQRKWNTGLSEYVTSSDLITIHDYTVEAEVEKDALLEYEINFDYWFNTFSHASDFIITEFNTKPSAWIGNTWLNAAYVFKFFTYNKGLFQDICIHNGVTPDKYGIIFNLKKEQVRNTSYFAYKMAGEGENYFINTGEGYSIQGKAKYYYSDSLLSSVIQYGEGTYIPPFSFGYIVQRDTLICHDSTFISDYRDTVIVTYTIDTIPIVECKACDNFWYRKFHRLTCRYCRLYGDYKIVFTKQEDIIQIPVYTTIQICNLIKL